MEADPELSLEVQLQAERDARVGRQKEVRSFFFSEKCSLKSVT